MKKIKFGVFGIVAVIVCCIVFAGSVSAASYSNCVIHGKQNDAYLSTGSDEDDKPQSAADNYSGANDISRLQYDMQQNKCGTLTISGSDNDVRFTLEALTNQIKNSGYSLKSSGVTTLKYNVSGEMAYFMVSEFNNLSFLVNHINSNLTVLVSNDYMDIQEITSIPFKLKVADNTKLIVAGNKANFDKIQKSTPTGYTWVLTNSSNSLYERKSNSGSSGNSNNSGSSNNKSNTNSNNNSNSSSNKPEEKDPTITASEPTKVKTADDKEVSVQVFGSTDQGIEQLAKMTGGTNSGNEKFVSALEELTKAGNQEFVFIQLEDGISCKGGSCATQVKLQNLKVNTTYFIYHVDEEGNLTLVGEFISDEEGNGVASIQNFSGNIVTTIQLAKEVLAPESDTTDETVIPEVNKEPKTTNNLFWLLVIIISGSVVIIGSIAVVVMAKKNKKRTKTLKD